MITSEQMRGARAMLKWSIKELSNQSGVSVATIQRMEQDGGVSNTLAKNVDAITITLEGSGIQFLGEYGIVLEK